jgi:splicing factor 3A subunit 3
MLTLVHAALEAKFSGEEGLGRYLDLTQSFQVFLNLKGAKKVSYLTFLEDFGKWEDLLPIETRRSGEYKGYVLFYAFFIF